ncbi:MAG: hypothetical protein JNM57_16205 [Cyclobacteriaceae bacterium]|nr:hypothetical protein [Cyclobacteriaceae bacterium]
MKLLESEDPVKNQLIQKSVRQREELEEEIKLVSERTEKALTNALIIGGALIVTYFVFRQFSESKTKTKTNQKKIKTASADENVDQEVTVSESPLQGIAAQIGTAIATQATVFLLGLAKEKLAAFLQSQVEKKESK